MITRRNIQRQNVDADCSAPYSAMAASVLERFARLARSGETLAPGTALRFGWSLLRLVATGDGLRVTEPAFAGRSSENQSQTIDTTLSVLADQVALLRHLGVDGADVAFDQVLVAAPGSLAGSGIFLRRRTGLTPRDSGWLLGLTSDPEALTAGENLEAIEIGSLVARRPAVLKVLTLPVDFIATFSGDRLTEIFDSAGRSLPVGSAEAIQPPPAGSGPFVDNLVEEIP